jgi:hypothetical protein
MEIGLRLPSLVPGSLSVYQAVGDQSRPGSTGSDEPWGGSGSPSPQCFGSVGIPSERAKRAKVL